MMHSCPSRDVCQTFRDACCNMDVGGGCGKREEQLDVVSLTVVRDPCSVIAEFSNLVCRENRSSPNAEPRGTPVSRRQGWARSCSMWPERCDLSGMIWTRLEQSEMLSQPEWRGGFVGWPGQTQRISRGERELASSRVLERNERRDTVLYFRMFSESDSSSLVHIIPDKSQLSSHVEQLQNLLSGNWCPSGLSIRTTSVFNKHLFRCIEMTSSCWFSRIGG